MCGADFMLRGGMIVAATVAFALTVQPEPAFAQAPDNRSVAPELTTVRVDENLDGELPLDLVFRDEEGKDVTLGKYFEEGKPVVLTLGYYECPMLCNLVLNGVVESLKALPFTPGEDFEIVSVSIDPLETPELAKAKKARYVEVYGKEGASESWHFLTGSDENARALADAVGFHYNYVTEKDEYAHPAVIFVATPDGRTARYLYGVRYDPKTLRLSLVEAAEGKVGSTIDRVLLYCFHYDAAAGTYVPAALNLMRAGGLVTMVLLGLLLLYNWRRDPSRTKRASEPAHVA